ncbi:MAG: hypothetical protein R3A52_29340 [Polyangiales bacterium]
MNTRVVAFGALALAAGCDPLLGGRCADGWTPSPGACDAGADLDAADAVARDVTPDVDVVLDAADATERDVTPDVDVVLDAGPTDLGPTDVPSMDVLDGGSGDGGPGDGGSGDGGSGDGGGRVDTGCTPPEVLCGAACVDPASDNANCGRCGNACAAGEVCAGGMCNAFCGPPLLLCDGACIDPMTDPANCGGCGVVCSTGICNGGRCRDARAGHLVLIGHDYQTTRLDQNRVVGNAVFLSAAPTPRVANFIAWARTPSVLNVREAIRQVAGARSFTERTITSPSELPSAFSVDQTDVVLVQHQATTTDAALEALGLRVAGPAVGFMRAGGVVIVLDGESTHRGTWPLARATGLVDVVGHIAATGEAAELVDAADAVAIGLPVAYRAERGSVVFTGTDGTGVVLRSGALPLVLHRVVFGL